MPTIRFTNQITGEAVSSQLWDFGDGSTSPTTASIIDHVYASTGSYTVRLDGTSISSQTDSTTKIVTVV